MKLFRNILTNELHIAESRVRAFLYFFYNVDKDITMRDIIELK